MSKLIHALGVVILLAILAAAPAAAGDPVQVRITGVDAADFPNVRATVSITDAAGQPIDGLSASDIIVSEDGRPQRASLSPIGEQRPIALVLALDVSGSMAGKPLADAKAAMTQLVGSLRGVDSAAVITFNTSVSLAQPLTTDKSALAAAIGGASANGNTAIFDALDTAIDTLAPVDPKARRAVVLLTDGVDNSSAHPLASVAEKLRAQKYPLYVVGLGTSLDEGTLRALADAGTGGGLTIAPSSAQLTAIYAALAQEIRVQYDVSYRSDTARAAEGSEIALTLQVVRAGAVVGTGRVTFTVPAGHAVVPAVTATDVRIPSTAQAPTEGGRVDPSVVGLLGGLSTLALLLWVSTVVETRALAQLAGERLERYVGLGERVASPRRSFFSRAVRPMFLRLAAPFGRFAPRQMVENTRLKLVRSGGPLDLSAVEFIGLRVGLAFVLGIAAALVATLLHAEMMAIALVALVGMLFGYLIPGLWLDRIVKARQRRILRALPSALDMLALSAGAGMTLDGAVGQVAQRWKGPLSDEFRQLLIEFNMGRDRRAALRALGERTGVQEVTRFANAVVQADALGTPISRVLSDQAVEMRTRRRQRAEEAARTAPVKMLFPMVGLIFPALFVVILGPAVPRFMELFRQAY